MDGRVTAVRVGLTTAVVLGAVLGALLLVGVLHPVDLITPGTEGPSAAVIAKDFGPESVREGTGYDGQQFYAIARFFPDLDAAASSLDAPRYRMLRIVEPAIASVGGAGTPVVLLLTLLNVLGAALACGALASLCEGYGWRPTLGYLAAVPVAFGIVGSTADPLSLGLALAGMALAQRHRHLQAVAVFVVAALTREQVAAVPLAVAAGLWLSGHRPRVLALYALPAAAVVAWYLALGGIVGGALPDRFDVLAMFSTGAEGLLVAVVSLAISLYGAWAWRHEPVAWLVALGFGLWIFVYFAGTFDIEALPRTTAPSLALGLAALGALRPVPAASPAAAAAGS